MPLQKSATSNAGERGRTALSLWIADDPATGHPSRIRKAVCCIVDGAGAQSHSGLRLEPRIKIGLVGGEVTL